MHGDAAPGETDVGRASARDHQDAAGASRRPRDNSGGHRLEPPSPRGDLSSLDLPQLRAYRHTLTAEEDRVSYWRRILHARLDVLQAEARSEEALTFEQLVRALGDTATGARRQAILAATPADVLPELPELEELWSLQADVHDPVSVAAMVDRLRALERQLTAYRRALHERLDHATTQLVDRYRQDPRAALDLIPGA